MLGQRVFAANCSACHGLDGLGSERAPNIVTNLQAQRLSEDEVLRIVLDGVPGTGMPPFRSLGQPAIKAVVGYLRTLQGNGGSAALPGDAQRGKAVFFGVARCSACHMVGGEGGFIAPDLTTYARTHAANEILAAITSSAARDSLNAAVTAVTFDGQQYRGIVRNEDNFSLQLQGSDGTFYFLSKFSLSAIAREPGSLMPSDYGSKLNKEQLNDVVSYLMSLTKAVPGPTHDPEDE